MCILYRLSSLVLATALVGCGGSLTLPDDGSPAALTAVGGNGQEAPVGSRLDDPLVVKLTDGGSRPIAGVSVAFEFKVDAPDAQIDSEAETDSLGLASAQVRLGTSTGPHEVEARVASAQLTATFVVTATARGKGGKGGGHGGDDDDEDDEDD